MVSQRKRGGCGAGWEASVFSKKDGKKIRKTFASKAEAKTWRDDANAQLSKGGLRAYRHALERGEVVGASGVIRVEYGWDFKEGAIEFGSGTLINSHESL